MRVVLSVFAIAFGASLSVLFLAAALFGFHLSTWPEWLGRMVGLASTVAAVAAAAKGAQVMTKRG